MNECKPFSECSQEGNNRQRKKFVQTQIRGQPEFKDKAEYCLLPNVVLNKTINYASHRIMEQEATKKPSCSELWDIENNQEGVIFQTLFEK